jgi:CDP-4-dehydro-6-deoxyglucose reductase
VIRVPKVRLVKSGTEFEVAPDETIMEGAERAGIFMVHSCLSGTCRAFARTDVELDK